MGIFDSMTGMVEAELTSADIPGAMGTIGRAGIVLKDVFPEGELTIRFRLHRRHYRKLAALAAQRGEKLRLLSRRGLYWSMKSILRRGVLMVGMVMLLVMALYVPGRIYFVEVEGNESVPTRQILEAAESCGIGFGASRRAVRSEKMKNNLLAAMPELGWAGVNTYGCVAVITVRERAVEEQPEQTAGVSSIVAACDGVIISCDAFRGSAICAVGQAVRQGQVLISGYTDCGICITATRAEGEVFAKTRHAMTAVTPSECFSRGEAAGQSTKYTLIVGKKRINFYKGSGISEGTCGKMVTEYHLTLPGGFRLPVTLVKEQTVSAALSAGETGNAEALLSDFAESYLHQTMIAGQITDRSQRFTTADGITCLTGEYACTEMIGRVRAEQNGEYNETN